HLPGRRRRDLGGDQRGGAAAAATQREEEGVSGDVWTSRFAEPGEWPSRCEDEIRGSTVDLPTLAALLHAVGPLVRRYVVLTSAQRDAVALWIAHTHALDAFDVTPYLDVNSPERRSGKSRLFDLLELLVARPWKVIAPSEAVVFRKIDRDQPTLLLDEV